jgi:simple sugar transport system ATP-binding protein
MAGPLLEARGILKSFGQVDALRGANFTVHAGEVVALIGDNGAGKSTLVGVLSGVLRPDAGEILLDGEAVQLASPWDARRLGIETVYQDLALCPTLGAAANLFYGREVLWPGVFGRLGLLDRRAMRGRAGEAFAALGLTLADVDVPVANLSGGQRQSVAICRAVTWAQRVVFMDEPTAALGVVQTGRVLDLIRRVRDRGTAVVLISHNMPQVLDVADRIEVLRLGARVAQLRRDEASGEKLVSAMTGAHTPDTV